LQIEEELAIVRNLWLLLISERWDAKCEGSRASSVRELGECTLRKDTISDKMVLGSNININKEINILVKNDDCVVCFS